MALRLEPLERRDVPAGTWTAFTNLAPSGIGTMMLLSDGFFIGQGGGNNWYKLTPGANGGYASSGTWSAVAPIGTQRLYCGGLNGTAKLRFGTTVKDGGSADAVTAAPSSLALDCFFQGLGDTLGNQETGEHVNNT